MSTAPETALWVITPGGLDLANQVAASRGNTTLYVSRNLEENVSGRLFDRLGEEVQEQFGRFAGHVFFMSTGIVVRVIAGLLHSKVTDPAVVAVDDAGHFAVSLLSGHLGGANDLARQVAAILDAVPVITTATDVNQLPAIDMLAGERDLWIENPEQIKTINMAILRRQPIRLIDPYNLMGTVLDPFSAKSAADSEEAPVVVVDDRIEKGYLAAKTLYLRPGSLSVGTGCNRGTPVEEIKGLLEAVCREQGLSLQSIRVIGTIDIKQDEAGIVGLGQALSIPVRFFNKDQLNQVETIGEPSVFAKKYTGAKSVCEAAAILAAGNGRLIVTKHKTRNVTIAIARRTAYSM